MSGISLDFDFKPIQAELKKLRSTTKYGNKVMADVQDIMIGEIRTRSPKKTGRYARSWKAGNKDSKIAEVITDQGRLFAILEFQGSRGATITPKNAKALRFELPDGTVLFRMKANPKGFEPIPHVRPAMRRILKLMPDIMAAHMDEISKMFAADAKKSKGRVSATKQRKTKGGNNTRSTNTRRVADRPTVVRDTGSRTTTNR